MTWFVATILFFGGGGGGRGGGGCLDLLVRSNIRRQLPVWMQQELVSHTLPLRVCRHACVFAHMKDAETDTTLGGGG